MSASPARPYPDTFDLRTALDTLFAAPPALHRSRDLDPTDEPGAEDGLVSNWGLQESFLRLLPQFVTPDSLTLETGSGLSTICMAMIGSEHICISPSQKEHNRIRRYCTEHGISTRRIRFMPVRSANVLPAIDFRGRKIDFALLDGAHAFPMPMVDYYFVNQHLRVGGLLAIDDVPITSVGVLHRFLMTEPAYELVAIDQAKTALYRKISEPANSRDWLDQRFNSNYPDLSFLDLPARIRHRLAPMEYKLRDRLGRIPGLRRAYHLLKGLANGQASEGGEA